MSNSAAPKPSGGCNTSLSSRTLRDVKTSCETRALDITPTGKNGPIKNDYISAIYTYDMGLTDLEPDLQDRIRIFVSWFIKKTVDKMQSITIEHFDVDCILCTKKGDICTLILAEVSQHPELPDIPGLCNLSKSLGTERTKNNDQCYSSISPESKQSSSGTEGHLPTGALDDWVKMMAALAAQAQTEKRDAFAGMFEKMTTSNGPQIPEIQGAQQNFAKTHNVTSEGATSIPANLKNSIHNPSRQEGIGKLNDVVKQLRDIASTIEKNPTLAYLFAPTLLHLGKSLGSSN